MNTKILLQNLRSFVVQIRHVSTEEIVGTGFLVSDTGAVVTCAHVWQAASTVDHNPQHKVKVYLSQLDGDKKIKTRVAELVAQFPQGFHDDVVLLQIMQAPRILPEQVAILGDAQLSVGNTFWSYGYRQLDSYMSGFAEGRILGLTEPPMNKNLRYDPIQLQSSQINRGMSGAPILDIERNLVVGLVSQTWYPDQSMKDRDTAWAVNARVLNDRPFKLKLRRRDYPLQKSPQPDRKKLPKNLASRSAVALHDVPPNISEWVGREELLQALDNDWADSQLRVTGLVGFGGEGKSSLVRRWLTNVFRGRILPKPEGIFWWSFYSVPNVGAFLKALIDFLVEPGLGEQFYEQEYEAQIHFIAALLSTKRFLLILDGLEVMQHQYGEQYGLMLQDKLAQLLQYLASNYHHSHTFITSRAPIIDLIDFKTYVHRDVNRLTMGEGQQLLHTLGVRGERATLGEIVSAWDGHALTLSLIGAYLVKFHGGAAQFHDQIPIPTAQESRYEQVNRILRRYDEHLTDEEKFFLTVLSNDFRRPIQERSLIPTFRQRANIYIQIAKSDPMLAAGSDEDFATVIKQLCSYRILQFESKNQEYIMHALIRTYYIQFLSGYTGLLSPEDYWTTVFALHSAKLLLFVLDVSWSMAVAERLISTKTIIRMIASHLFKNARPVGLITFNKNEAQMILKPTSSIEQLMESLQDIVVGGKSPLAAGLQLAHKFLRENETDLSQSLLLLFTDGVGNVSISGLPPLEEAYHVADQLRTASVKSLVYNMEHPAFDQGYARNLAERLGGDCINDPELKRRNSINPSAKEGWWDI